MNMWKLKYYIEVLQISINIVYTFYLIPIKFIDGEYAGALGSILLAVIFWFISWNSNATFHELLEKFKD